MSDFLGHLATRALTAPSGVRPLGRSLFEPPLNVGPQPAAGATMPSMEHNAVEEAMRPNPPNPVVQCLAEVEALWSSAPASGQMQYGARVESSPGAKGTILNQTELSVSRSDPSLANNKAGKEFFKE